LHTKLYLCQTFCYNKITGERLRVREETEGEKEKESVFGLVLVIALQPQTPKHIRGGWSRYTDTSEPVDGK
jgi:hypothetical protein